MRMMRMMMRRMTRGFKDDDADDDEDYDDDNDDDNNGRAVDPWSCFCDHVSIFPFSQMF